MDGEAESKCNLDAIEKVKGSRITSDEINIETAAAEMSPLVVGWRPGLRNNGRSGLRIGRNVEIRKRMECLNCGKNRGETEYTDLKDVV